MAPARTRMLALAAGLLFAFAIGTYYGRDHIYEHVSRWSGKNGFRPILSDEHGNMFASPKQGKSPAGPAFENYDSLPIGSKTQQRANAAFVVLVRNQELPSILESIQQVEHSFNRKYHYPYVFLNDVPFETRFIESVSSAVSGNSSFGLIKPEHWQEPSWIDKNKAAAARKEMEKNKVIYGGSETYRRMCRYQSGFFYRHELLDSYDYYWRIEPGVKYFCDMDYDPFLFMQQNQKDYGFTISLKEYEATIPTLWNTVKDFMAEHPEHIAKDNSMDWLSNDKGKSYNLCHFWSNFEIGSLNFLRSKAYSDYFDYLDRSGGFSYERWGDAPVHSIAAALFLPTERVHFFEKVGYYHVPFQHCPTTAKEQGCFCDAKESFEFNWYSCTSKWHDLIRRKGLE